MNPQRFKTKNAKECVRQLNERIRQARVIRAFAPIREAARVRQLVSSAREWLYLAMMYDAIDSGYGVGSGGQYDKWQQAYHRRFTKSHKPQPTEF